MTDRTPPKLSAATLLASRRAALAVTAAAAAQVALVRAGAPSWPCPVLHALGVPCPGCGLTRASLALASGDWRAALALHAFSPVLVVALATIAASALLPEGPRRSLVSGVEILERRARLSLILPAGLICYWLARLLISPGSFIGLMRG
jgi:hypothetical protein